MSANGAELLIAGVAVVALLLAPVASRLIEKRGQAISSELDGGRTGSDLTRHLDRQYESRIEGGESGMREAEIRQMLEAKAYGQRSRGEPEIDVGAELQRLLSEEVE